MKFNRLIPLVILLWAIAACQTMSIEPEMSFEAARDVVLSMQSVPLEPPPRRMDDILAVLETRPDIEMEQLQALIHRADLPPPDLQNPTDLYQFYKARGYARCYLSRFNQCRADMHAAMTHDRQAGIGDISLQQRLAELEMYAGRYESALQMSKDILRARKLSGWRVGPYRAFQSRVHHRMGNFFRAGLAIANAKAAYAKVPATARFSLVEYGGEMDMGNENDILAAEAEMLEAQGLFDRAHTLRSRLYNYHYSKRQLKPINSIHAQIDLATNLMHRGRLVVAEQQARLAVIEAVDASGKQSGITAESLQTLGEIILAKGDLQNAVRLSAAQVDILTQLELAPDEDVMVRARLFRGGVLVAAEDFQAAMSAYDLALKGMADNPYFTRRYAQGNVALMLCLIRNGRVSEAGHLLRQSRGAGGRYGPLEAPWEAQRTALEAMILHSNRQIEAALDKFSDAVPGLVDVIQAPDSTFLNRRLADILLQTYIEILLELYERGSRQVHDIDIAGEIFKLADARAGRVHSALGQSSARAASLADPELAELVRQEQDAAKKIKSLQAVLVNAVAASGGSADYALSNLERSIRSLAKARAAMVARIEKEFPRYSRYIRPSPPTINEVQTGLAHGEAFLSIWTLPQKTCVWAIPHEGEPAFAVVDLDWAELGEKVDHLRAAVRSNARLVSEIPDFELDIAFEIYRRLLKPVATGWQKATDLLVVVKGPLDQLPLSVLVTAPAPLGPEPGVRFAAYASVPWLIRKVSISRLPSAASLLTLRSLPRGRAGREAFAGFGDPIFNPASAPNRGEAHPRLADAATGSATLAVRGLRISELGHLDSSQITSVTIEDLCRLPDTAEELTGIAASLDADPEADVFLGKSASETRVKTTDLARQKVLAFATHALLPGDLDGLNQPALAFSSPKVTRQDEDGLLTVGEILTLKLDADLVVLSACDTGAGHGSGNEAVSGLGRAFFYSGARSLLVTMWPVETTSANSLTTRLFRFQKDDHSLTRAQALRKSMLSLMDSQGLKNPADGSIAASYAHPFFWAPFVIVGEGGGARR
jgi:CHAT domain-containing protein